MTAAPHRLAVVGIDGSGKTSLVARLRERMGASRELVTITSPAFHETPDAPLRLLSRQLHAVSLAADALDARDVKAAMLYLQMTMYGTVERCLVDAFAPRRVVSDRHAMVDTLTYGPFYKHLLRGEVDADQWEARLRAALGDAVPHAFEATLAWHERVAARVGSATSFWALAQEVAAIFEQPHAEVLAELERRYETTLPDAVVFLDVDPEEALRRAGTRRTASSEMHESAEMLAALRGIYLGSLEVLEREHPEMAVHRVDATGLGLDDTLDAVLGLTPA